MATVNQPQTGEWRHQLFQCLDSIPDSLFAYFLGPCYAYVVAQATGEDGIWPVCTCLIPCLLIFIRGDAREKRGIQGNVVKDCVVVCCCSCCAMVQMKREFE